MISLIASAIRPQFWMELYNSLRNNVIPFEIVFVGNKRPEFELPGNFRFVYSEVKPAQCFEIAARNASGDFIVVASDDYEFSENALDKLYEKHCQFNPDKFETLVSCRYKMNGKIADWALYYIVGSPSPRTEMCALWPITTVRKLGGGDRRFVALYWNVDMTMRFFEMGGKMEYAEDAFVNELDSRQWAVGCHRLHSTRWPQEDRAFMDSLWMKDGVILDRRTKSFEPYEDRELLTVSQGNKGDWA